MASRKQKRISHSSRGWESEIRCQHGWILLRIHFWVADCCPLIAFWDGRKRVRELPGILCKGTNPIHTGFTIMTACWSVI